MSHSDQHQVAYVDAFNEDEENFAAEVRRIIDDSRERIAALLQTRVLHWGAKDTQRHFTQTANKLINSGAFTYEEIFPTIEAIVGPEVKE